MLRHASGPGTAHPLLAQELELRVALLTSTSLLNELCLFGAVIVL